MVYYEIAKIHYQDNDTSKSISRIKTTNDIEKLRQTVVADIENGHQIKTHPSNGGGAEVHVIQVANTKYLRTDRNSVAKDNLGNLPQF
ncbi:MAG: DUF3892 domain-containing protein [Eubacteriales bacterium]|nr:DUF3892 domain-containing protein [Eubacteriales bacterium]